LIVGKRVDLGRSRVRLNAAIDVYSNSSLSNLQDIGILRTAYSDYAENVQTFRRSLSTFDLMLRRALAGKSLNFREVAAEAGLTVLP
jgi:hypothetical protein